MEKRFNGKTALVTGGSRGIGKSIVQGLLSSGADVFALGKSPENLEKLQAEFPAVHNVNADLADWTATRQAVEKIGPIDFLVNNAATLIERKFLEVDEDILNATLDINVKAVVNVSQVVSQGMIRDGRPGAIVNISSVASSIVTHGTMAYSMSKWALDGLTHHMTLELGEHNIRVNGVNPTIIMTDLSRQIWADPVKNGPYLARHPIGRFGEAEEVTNAVLFLLSDEASLITGACLPVDGDLPWPRRAIKISDYQWRS